MRAKKSSYKESLSLDGKRVYIKALSLFICLTVLLSFSGCTSSEKTNEYADKNGEAVEYTISEIYENESWGFYVKNKNNTFTPVVPIDGFSDIADEYDSSRSIWYTDITDRKATNKITYSKAVPKVTDDTPLVAIFDNSDDMPSSYILEEYKPMGYSIGAKVGLEDDEQTMYMSSTEICSGSSAANAMGSDIDDTLPIESINGEDATNYISNVDTNINMLRGLEKNKYYTFQVHIGTQTKSAKLKADTRFFKSKNVLTLEEPLITTNEQYYIVNLPKNLSTGSWYYINDVGAFQY